ncbi:MAG: uracil-DNA glycosylase [Bacteroidia bacterium]|nr:uracil-DNA glycosylase [Bacteroidia bacterium]MDW8333625.1 uracil-DNA glycosylase [Bacteroidia bacterium]
MAVNIEPGWFQALESEFDQPYFQALVAFLRSEKAKGKTIYPPGPQIFAAFWLTPPSAVKVVILGQDPYHNPGQAHGLAFSVPYGVPPPPSLQRIFQEIKDDLGVEPPDHGCLEEWAKRGVLLLNAILTVEAGKVASHQRIGWERFTDAVIAHLNRRSEPTVFMLWGKYAQEKAAFVGPPHLTLKAAHPSPLARTGFLGCRHFSRANEFLVSVGREPVDWSLPRRR